MKNFSILIAILLISSFVIHASCQQGKRSTAEMKNVTADDFKKLVDSKDGVILDVRTPQEFAEGHISGAVNIDVKAENFQQEIEKLDKSKKYNVYCKSGRRSALASQTMLDAGFKQVTNLEGGILGWQEKGFAVEK